ncbi:flagellar hook-basal body complex protein [Candidatus Puniceispirillum marinum]|uniref:Flagellar hook protein FlgE n=1 Tax=Puniceispirillum marinum (strain IMCC1322) TaxID=488538 RepID=D5BS45_PUNMI|nr:flagellar hook-basal body complex protein [Candidatus Puniceispirillum marinum]ADE39092.1 hypothetical protein SAR116_0849 [Candidatus Puniceispirillum marinum IMCC1322]
MSFYTALTGLNGSSADISATSNNIANVGTTGFKRSRVEFGDIFATSPLQNSSSSLGSGAILKGVKQQFTQGNIASSLNALDLAISGQGFFALKPSLTSAQTVYTRNGSLNVDNDRYVVDSAGQYLLTYPVNNDGSVTAKDLQSAVPLQLPVTSGDPQATSNINLGVNVPASSEVVTDQAQFADGYTFNPDDASTFTNSTSITIFDDLGNPTIATVYFIKTQSASADDPTNKYDTRLVINDQIIDPDLVSSVDEAGNQVFIDRFGRQTTTVPDDNYFLEGKGSPLYKLDDLQKLIPSSPATIKGEQTSFDFGEEGDKLVEIVTDPLEFKATREGGNAGGDVYWGKDFLLINVDDSDQPVSIDIRPGTYNATQLAAEVERSVNAAYGDDRKLQIVQNLDDKIKIDLKRTDADGAVSSLDTAIEVDLLGTDSFVSENITDFDIDGSSPDITREDFLAHTQVKINEALNSYNRTQSGNPLGVENLSFTRSTSNKINTIYEYNNIVTLDRLGKSTDVTITAGTINDANSEEFTIDLVADEDGDGVFESSVTLNSGTLVLAQDTATTIAAALAIDSDVSGTTSKYEVSASNGVLTIARPDGVNFSVLKGNSTFPTGSSLQVSSADISDTLTVTKTTTGTVSATEVQSVAGLDATGLANLAGKSLTLGESGTINFGTSSLVVSKTTTGTASVAEVQSITGLTTTGLANLAGQKLTVSDGTNSISHTFTSAPADVAAVVTAIQGATGYGNLLFTASAGTDAVSLTYKSAAVITTTSTATQASAAVTVDFTTTPTLAEVVSAVQGHSNYADLGFTVSAGTDALTLTYAGNGVVATTTAASVGKMVSDDNVDSQYMAYSYFGNRPSMDVYDTRVAASGDATTSYISYTATQNKMKIFIDDAQATNFTVGANIRLSGKFPATEGNAGTLNGREFEIVSVASSTTTGNTTGRGYVEVSTSGLALAENDFTIAGAAADVSVYILANESTTTEAFFEGSYPVYEGSQENYSSKRMVVREIGSKRTDLGGFVASSAAFDNTGTATDLAALGLDAMAVATTAENSTIDWVDEKNPAIKVGYDAVNQRLNFTVDRTVLGSGTDSNFSSYSIYGSNATGSNNLGIPSQSSSSTVPIKGGEILFGDSFISDGEEVQPNDKRYGISVNYNSDLENFEFSSGSTGETIAGDGAIGVETTQKSSNIQVGRYTISATDGSAIKTIADADARIIGNGENQLLGVGSTKTDFIFTEGRGLKATAAVASGASANEDLSSVFKLSAQTGENVFNISVNGISGIIEVPAGSYVGSTLASALEKRINQISDPVTGDPIGGVSVSYDLENNNLSFTTGTTGDSSTIKVKGIARLGLDDVPLGVGSVPEIYNLVQATNDNGVALYVSADGKVVESPPENLVEGYYPLYIDEGELTFDKTGALVSPKNNVHYEKQEEGFSIALDVDFAASTQFAQPFSVLSVQQDGFTSGRLDGLEIDSSGTIRANYTNGQNNPLGKIVVANFNNQNGLKQIGNATYVETAVSGTPQVGEAGAEGFGNILSGSLERSNVDITEELVNLITAQRNYQASAKAIETTTGLTQTIINIRM